MLVIYNNQRLQTINAYIHTQFEIDQRRIFTFLTLFVYFFPILCFITNLITTTKQLYHCCHNVTLRKNILSLKET